MNFIDVNYCIAINIGLTKCFFPLNTLHYMQAMKIFQSSWFLYWNEETRAVKVFLLYLLSLLSLIIIYYFKLYVFCVSINMLC